MARLQLKWAFGLPAASSAYTEPTLVDGRIFVASDSGFVYSIDAARKANLPLIGVVMVGRENSDNRKAIERYGKIPVVGAIPWLESINRSSLIRVFDQQFDKTAFA